MIRMMRAGLAASVLMMGAWLIAAPAAAQDPAPAGVGAQGASADASAQPASPQMPDAFAKAERLEALRYQHLWIAYGAIWLIVFVFVWRTWRSSEALGAELDGLKARLADLEGRDERG